MKDYYAILGIQRHATARTIQETYTRLAKRYHPDFNSSPEAQQILDEINEAYEVLKNPELKEKYDLSLQDETNDINSLVTPTLENNTQRLSRLKKEYASIFAWCCKVGLVVAILIALDALIPPQVSVEEIADVQYHNGGGGRFRYRWIEVYTYHRIYKLYSGTSDIEVGKVVTWRISRLFRNVLSVQGKNSVNPIWVARIYTNLSFLPIILLVASASGVYLKEKTDWVISAGTVSFASGALCLALLL